MKKIELYNIGKKDYQLPENIITSLCLKHLSLDKSQLFLLDEIDNVDKILFDFERTRTEPYEYVLWFSEFYGKNFIVDKRVLIPRNDTEIMVEKAVEYINTSPDVDSYIDVGTGTSCIAISVYTAIEPKLKNAYVSDISHDALQVSLLNRKNFGLETSLLAFQWNLLEAFFCDEVVLGKNLVITANLPYIKNWDFQNMDAKVYQNEPHLALFGGEETGFELYESLYEQSLLLGKQRNMERIVLFLELGFDQIMYAKKYFEAKKTSYQIFSDGSNMPRLMVCVLQFDKM